MKSGFDRLPFAYESTGKETRFTNGLNPDPRSRRVFTFHRPQTMAAWIEEHDADPDRPSLRHRLRHMPPLEATGLWQPQFEAGRRLRGPLPQTRFVLRKSLEARLPGRPQRKPREAPLAAGLVSRHAR